MRNRWLLFLTAPLVLYGLFRQWALLSSLALAGISLLFAPFFGLYILTVQPIITVVNACKQQRTYHLLLQHNYDERSALLQELIQARAEIAQLRAMQASGVSYQPVDPLRIHTIAQIIYRQPGNDDPFFIIDKGSSQPIEPYMVAAVQGRLLGRVTAVYPFHARVMPVTHKGCHVPIVCATSQARGIFHGNGIDFVSHLEPLIIDELVLTSGDGLVYPPGLALGRIKQMNLNQLGFLYDVLVESLNSDYEENYCQIVSKKVEQKDSLC